MFSAAAHFGFCDWSETAFILIMNIIINISLETVVCLRICAKAVDRICESNQNAADSFCDDLFDFDPTALN